MPTYSRIQIHKVLQYAHRQTDCSECVSADAVELKARINGLVMLLQKVAYLSTHTHAHMHISIIRGSARSGPSVRVRVESCSGSQ